MSAALVNYTDEELRRDGKRLKNWSNQTKPFYKWQVTDEDEHGTRQNS